MKNYKAGDIIKVNGQKCTILDMHYKNTDEIDKILCVCNDILCSMPMYKNCNKSDNYKDSNIIKYLDKLTIEWEKEGVYFCETYLDMVADDGSGWDISPVYIKGFFLLTKDMYKKYRRYMPEYNNPIWLSTKWSYNFATYFCFVGSGGNADYYNANNTYGLAPAFVLATIPPQDEEIKIGDKVIIIKPDEVYPQHTEWIINNCNDKNVLVNWQYDRIPTPSDVTLVTYTVVAKDEDIYCINYENSLCDSWRRAFIIHKNGIKKI